MTRLQSTPLNPEILQALEQFDSCTISNAIEQFNVRTRNEGFVHGSVHCIFPQLSARAGYAATARMRSSATPIARRLYYDRPDWWSYVLTIPEPRFIVMQDVDAVPGVGALVGRVHAHIARALGCAAYITNGAIRHLSGVAAAGLQVFAGNITVSHAYAHVIDFGEPVEIDGLQVSPGDLLHCDQNGIVSVPTQIADRIPAVAKQLLNAEADLIEFCRSGKFSFEELAEKTKETSGKLGHHENIR